MQPKWYHLPIILIIGVGIGHYSRPDKVTETSKSVTTDDKTIVTKEDDKKKTVIVEKPDGTTVTIITDDDKKSTDVKDDKTTDIEKTKETINNSNSFNISLLAGEHDITNPLQPSIYGVSLNRRFVGPVTVGLWALSDKSAGFSIGLSL